MGSISFEDITKHGTGAWLLPLVRGREVTAVVSSEVVGGGIANRSV